jgi:hypothetical protein
MIWLAAFLLGEELATSGCKVKREYVVLFVDALYGVYLIVLN